MTRIEPIELLYAEDDDTDAEITLRALNKAKFSNRVVRVRDGEQALQYLRREGRYADRPAGNPKVVLLDLKMPKVSGHEVLQEIRRDASLRSIPVVIMTSSAEEVDVAKSYDLGVSSYIVKPVDFRKFAEAVAQVGFYWLAVNRPASQA